MMDAKQIWDQLVDGINLLQKSLQHFLIYTSIPGYHWLLLTLGCVAMVILSELSFTAGNLAGRVIVLQEAEQWAPPLMFVS